MPIFEFEKPDGSVVEVDAPTREAALMGYRRMSTATPMNPTARGVLMAGQTADEASKLSSNKLIAGAQLVGGAFDVAGGGIADLAERVEGLARGTIGAINPNDTYDAARRRTPTQLRDAEPVTQGGRVVASALGTVIGGTQIPDVLDAIGGGIESLFGKNAREAAGTVAEAATLGVPVTRARPAGPLAQTVERAEQLGYITPSYAVTSRAGARAGGATERALEGAATTASESAKSIINQNVTDRLVARAGRLTEQYTSPAAIDAAVTRAEAPYTEIRNIKVNNKSLAIPSDRTYFQAIDDITGSQQGGAGVKLPVDDAVAKLQTAMRSAGTHSTASLIDQIGILRSQGFRALKSLDDAAATRGAAQLKAADALEALLERGLERAAVRAQTTSPAAAVLLRRMIDQYRDGRAWRSDLHIIEESMLPGGSGVIDAHALARISRRRGGLNNPLLQGVADTAANFPAVTTPLPTAARGAAQTGIGAATRNEVGAIGATVGRLLARGSVALARSRRQGGGAQRVRAAARAGAVIGARATALEGMVGEENE